MNGRYQAGIFRPKSATQTGVRWNMDPSLRQAWTEIVTADDYEEHMASIGQAQAAAELTKHLIRSASLTAGGRITIAGAGTGQMFDFLAPAIFCPYRRRPTWSKKAHRLE